jgi:hypothetical protein
VFFTQCGVAKLPLLRQEGETAVSCQAAELTSGWVPPYGIRGFCDPHMAFTVLAVCVSYETIANTRAIQSTGHTIAARLTDHAYGLV